jgi:squalene-hopene/tetraprenyl-beta-curcumene cyclase
VLLPGQVLYKMSSWTRAIVVPLSIVQAVGGIRPVPAGFHLNELAVEGKSLELPRRDWTSVLFQQIDRAVKIWQRRGMRELRRSAIRAAEQWMMDRTRYSEGLGAVYPSMMYLIMALDALGYTQDHPDFATALRQFDSLLTETKDKLYFQPCFSPVWDTAYAAFVLGELGNAPAGRLRKAADWLIEREVRHKGEWSVKRPNLTPGGWAFQYENEHYPDIDDTAMVLMALMHAKGSDSEQQVRCEERALHWLVNMQSSNGGWAAFDVDNDCTLLNQLPFADHNAMLDPTCPDITGRVLEALCRREYGPAGGALQQGVQYLLRTQERDGGWWGRWGVNYVYGDVSGIARNTGVRGRPDWGQRDDGGTVDCVCAESGWRVGRDVRELCDREIRSWSKHAIANSLGHLGAARLGRPGVGGIAEGGLVSDRDTAR